MWSQFIVFFSYVFNQGALEVQIFIAFKQSRAGCVLLLIGLYTNLSFPSAGFSFMLSMQASPLCIR